MPAPTLTDDLLPMMTLGCRLDRVASAPQGGILPIVNRRRSAAFGSTPEEDESPAPPSTPNYPVYSVI
jgi:hypothetical protein